MAAHHDADIEQDYSDSESDATLEASECYSVTDSDEEDYRQLESPEVVLADAEPALDAPLSSLSVIPQIILPPWAHAPARLPSRREEESSGDALPDLVASSSSEESTDDEEPIRRNVRPRHAESFPPGVIAIDMGSPLRSAYSWGADADFQRDASARNNRQSASPLFFQRPAGNAHMPYPHMPFPNMPLQGETRTRANTSMHSPYQSWNSSGGFPEVAPRTFVQVLDTQTGQTWPVDQGMPGNGGARGGLPNLAPVDLLSSILGMGLSGMRLDPNSPAAAHMRNMPLDPFLQVLQASFNLPPQRKPLVSTEAYESVLLVKIGCEDVETVCPISAEVLEEGEWAARMPCGHYFGRDDLLEWLCANNSCPVCRYELPTDDSQYNYERHLSLEQVSKAAVSACQVGDDIIGKRMNCVREAAFDTMLEESWGALSILPEGWTHQHEAALAAAKRMALQRYYALEHSSHGIQTLQLDTSEQMLASSLAQELLASGNETISGLSNERQGAHSMCPATSTNSDLPSTASTHHEASCSAHIGDTVGLDGVGMVASGCGEEGSLASQMEQDALCEQVLVLLLQIRLAELHDISAADADLVDSESLLLHLQNGSRPSSRSYSPPYSPPHPVEGTITWIEVD